MWLNVRFQVYKILYICAFKYLSSYVVTGGYSFSSESSSNSSADIKRNGVILWKK